MTPQYAKLTLLPPSATSVSAAPLFPIKESEDSFLLVDASLKDSIERLLEKKQSPGLLLQDLNPDLISSLLNLLIGNCLFDVVSCAPNVSEASPKEYPNNNAPTGSVKEGTVAELSATLKLPPYINSIVPNQFDEWLTRVNFEIDKHLDDENFKACSLAKIVSLCEMQFHRKLKKITGLSPANYLRHYRLHKCLPMIAEGKLNFSEIAFSVGFRSLEYFSRSFKKEFGSNPSCYQQQIKCRSSITA